MARGAAQVHGGFRRDPLRARWRQLKAPVVAEVRVIDPGIAAEVQRVLRSRLGPLLAQLDREMGRYPHHDALRIGRLQRRTDRVLASYHRALDRALGDDAMVTAAWLRERHEELGGEERRRADWYRAAVPEPPRPARWIVPHGGTDQEEPAP